MNTDKDSISRAETGKPNMNGLHPLTRTRAQLRQAVEEAEWLGQEERADAYKLDLFFVEGKIAAGQVWEPEW